MLNAEIFIFKTIYNWFCRSAWKKKDKYWAFIPFVHGKNEIFKFSDIATPDVSAVNLLNEAK